MEQTLDNYLELSTDSMLHTLINSLMDDPKSTSSLREDLETYPDKAELFKTLLVNEIYWEYYIWNILPEETIKRALINTIYDEWSGVIFHKCMLCNERDNIKQCAMIHSAFVCEDHCDGSKEWITRMKGKPIKLSRKYCMMRRKKEDQSVTCKNPIWNE